MLLRLAYLTADTPRPDHGRYNGELLDPRHRTDPLG
jgi:hypothetical protein